MLSNVSLCVGAPVRVYLYSLVRRLLYSHLTPSTLSSPSLPPVLSPPVHSHPDTPSPPTTSLHGWLCLVLRSMHVCCLPRQTPQIESLYPPERPRLGDGRCTAIRNEHTCRGSPIWGTHRLSCSLDQCASLHTLNRSINLAYLAAQHTHTHCEEIFSG